MVKGRLIKTCLYVMLMVFLSACMSSENEAKKKLLYKKLIEHYELQEEVHKQKAVQFLFENIAYHSTTIDRRAKQTMDTCIALLLDSEIAIKGQIPQKGGAFIKNHFAYEHYKTHVEPDITYLSANYLIAHTDQTYAAWQQTSQAGEIDFETYCNYILPYRVMREPIEQEYALPFSTIYQKQIDSLLTGALFEPLMQSIIVNENIQLKRKAFDYPYALTVKQVNALKTVTSCDDAAIYFAMLFRSLGIPATVDVTKRCYRNNGHSLLALYWKQKWYSFEVPDGTVTLRDSERSLQNFPKVNRLAYAKSLNHSDVTKEYTPTVKLVFGKKLWDTSSKAVALFNNDIQFETLKISKRKLGFKESIDNVGVDGVYGLGRIRQGRFVADSVIYVDTLGHIQTLKPDYNTRTPIVLTRKYLMDKRQFVSKMPRIKSLNEICLEGFNSLELHDRDTLLVVSGFDKPYLVEYPLECKTKYKYLQVSKPGYRTFIAEYNMLNSKGQSIIGNDVKCQDLVAFGDDALIGKYPNIRTLLVNGAVKDVQKMVDKKGLSYGALGAAGKIIVFDPRGISPSAFTIQPRNDENHILIGDTYELMMWDKRWHSLGTQVAKSHDLVYEDVPSNALYWLRNLSRGKEEYPFIINDKGEQYWVGQAN